MPLLLPYKAGSKSAKDLATALGIKRVKLTNNNINRLIGKTVINWGNSTYPMAHGINYLNHPANIAQASNKANAFEAMAAAQVRPNLPAFTRDIRVARRWQEAGHSVVERHKLTGHSADGLVLKSHTEQLDDAPLYVQYMKKKEEYRVHVMKGTAFHVQRKARTRDVPDEQVNWQVRNLANGFIYQINLTENVPQDVLDQSVKAVNALGLDFGAVDVIYHRDTGATVLEVNTACGLAGTTLEKYTQALSQALRGDNITPFVQPQRVRGDERPQPAPVEPPVQDEPDPAPQEELQQHIDELDFDDEMDDNEHTINELRNVMGQLDDVDDEFLRENIELLRESVVKLNTRLLKLV